MRRNRFGGDSRPMNVWIRQYTPHPYALSEGEARWDQIRADLDRKRFQEERWREEIAALVEGMSEAERIDEVRESVRTINPERARFLVRVGEERKAAQKGGPR